MTDEQDRPRCPVTILGQTCDTPIEEGAGEAVAHNGRVWVVCQSCARRGVRIADVEHATPLFG